MIRLFFFINLLAFSSIINAQNWSTLNDVELGNNSIKRLKVIDDTLFIGGAFGMVNSITSTGLFMWDGNQVHLVSGITGASVSDFVLSDTSVVVGGTFPNVDNIIGTSAIASWNGVEWQSLGGGCGSITNSMRSLMIWQNKLFAAGSFSEIGTLSDINGFASWDGTQWSEEESTLGTFYAGPSCMEIYQGMLVGGGDFFLSTSGTTLNNVASFDGSSWHDLNGGVNNDVYGMFVDGDILYVGGTFSMAQNSEVPVPNNIAYFDGSNWQSVGEYEEIGNTIRAIAKYRDQIYVGGVLTLNGQPEQYFAYFDGVHWHNVPGSEDMNARVRTLLVYNDELYIGGDFSQAGGLEVSGIVRYYLHPDSVHWGVPDNIDELIQKRFVVFPNPAEQKLHVNTGEIVCDQLVISDLSGRIIYTEKIKERQDLMVDISDMKSGTLLLSLVHGGVVVATERVMKE